MKSILEKQIQLAFIFALLLLLTLGFFAYRSASALKEALKLEKHTQEVFTQLDSVLFLATNAETGGRGFVITGNDAYLEPLMMADQQINQSLLTLRELVADNAKQSVEIPKLESLIREKLDFMKTSVEIRRNQSLEAANNRVASGFGKRKMDEIRQLIGAMRAEESRYLKESEDELNRTVENTLFLLFFATGAGIVSLGLANLAVSREIGKRRAAESELREANKSLEHRVERRTEELSQANKELKEQMRQRELTETRRRIALESGSLGTWILDPRTNRAEVDERSLSLFGLSEHEFDGSGEKAFSRIHVEDFPSMEKLLQTSINERKKFNAEFRVLLPDGATRWNHCTGQPQFDENGEVMNIVGYCRDVTDTKEKEIFLRESEQFARKIIDNLFSFVGVMTPDGVLIEANRTALEAANLKPEDVLGKHFAETYWWAYSEETQKQLRESIEKAAKGERIRYDVTIRLGENLFTPIDFTLAPLFDGGGRITHLIPSGLDLTPRKEAEDRLRESENFARAILDSLTAHIAVLDKDGNIVAVNEAWQNFAESNCVEEQIHTTGIGQNYLKVCESVEVFEEETKDILENLRAVLKGEKTNFSFEYPCHSATEKRWFIMHVSSMQEAGGGAVIAHIDISERKIAERDREELLEREQAARKDAEIANRLRDEFLATVSHELRAPLNSILGWARMLEKGKLDEKTSAKAVTTIVRNAEAQNRLIEDLLDVSRIISGKLRLEVMTVKPINVVEQALETVRPAAEAKGIKLEIKENPDVSHISGDPNRLQQVIWNLLSNAIKFTPNEGKVALEIERDEDFLEIRVRDTGVGIKEEFLPHVFDRFTQADASSIRKFGGLGLGLAIVRHITEMHGGTVHAFSAGENKGSTFVVRLPIIASPKDDEAAQNKIRALENEPTINLDELLILVVDDEEDTRQLLVQSLTIYGATVLNASSAAEGLSAIEEKKPDVLVSDIGMPDEDGYSLIRKVRALEDEKLSRVPAIALTAFTRAQDRMRALSSGYQSHVAKPVEPDELATVIASLTGRLNAGEAE